MMNGAARFLDPPASVLEKGTSVITPNWIALQDVECKPGLDSCGNPNYHNLKVSQYETVCREHGSVGNGLASRAGEGRWLQSNIDIAL